MTGEKFTLMQYTISSILGMIDAEDFVIPEIQRPFVWKRSQVRDLIDSLYQGYPTGYIITWKNPDVKTKDGGRANGKKVLIDGQQRITALMAAISGEEVLDEDFNKDRIKIAFNPLTTDENKRFAVQDASHLKTSVGYRIYPSCSSRTSSSVHLKTNTLRTTLTSTWTNCPRRSPG